MLPMAGSGRLWSHCRGMGGFRMLLRNCLSSRRIGLFLAIGMALAVPRAGAAFSLVQTVHDDADGLGGAWAAAVSPDNQNVYVASKYENSVAIFYRDPATLEYRYYGKLTDGVDGVDGLAGAAAVAVSPNGLYVYVLGQSENALAVFERYPSTGTLNLLQVLRDGEGGVDGLATPTGVAVLPDGAYAGRVYVSSYADNALAVFDPGYPGLDFVDVWKNGVSGVTGLSGASAVVARNGTYGPQVYVSSQFDSSVAVFATDFIGQFSQVQVAQDGQSGFDGLEGALALDLSPDGQVLYVAGSYENAVAVLGRSDSTGLLSFYEVQRDGTSGVDGLANVTSVVMTADGKHVYAAGSFEPAVAIFGFDIFSSGLDYLQRVLQEPNPLPPFSLIRLTVAAFPDSSQVFVTNSYQSTLSVYDRDSGTGALSLDTLLADGAGVRAMRGAQSVVASPDGKHVYAMGSQGSLISSFARDAGTGGLGFLATVGAYGEDPHAIVPNYRTGAMSPDGNSLYETRWRDDAITFYARDSATGNLAGVGGVDDSLIPAMTGPEELELSADGENAYAVGGRGVEGWVMAFTRNPVTGALSHLQTLDEVDRPELNFANSIAVPVDGNHVYVAPRSYAGLSVFWRLGDGTLEFMRSYADQPGFDPFDAIQYAYDVEASPDGLRLCFLTAIQVACAVRNPVSGEISNVQAASTNGHGGYPGSLAFSPDGSRVFVAAYDYQGGGAPQNSALLAYSIDPASGALARIDEWSTDVAGAVSLAVSPDGRHVYLAAYGEDAVLAFAPEPDAVALAAAAGAALATLLRRRRLRFSESEQRR